jgi:UDP-N-acetylmuramoyl-L-alanyl-D-glutamate--2,6-diaminopimelate ligase
MQVVPDRRSAIRTGLQMASAGDVVLILGKGHEQGQEVSGRVEPFDDRVVAREELTDLEVAS